MKIFFLGTGAADWPLERPADYKEFRRLSSAVIDDTLLIDPGPQVLEALDTYGKPDVKYIINTRAILSGVHYINGAIMRRCAVENGVTTFTSLDTVRIVLDVLEEITNKVSTIDAE